MFLVLLRLSLDNFTKYVKHYSIINFNTYISLLDANLNDIHLFPLRDEMHSFSNT